MKSSSKTERSSHKYVRVSTYAGMKDKPRERAHVRENVTRGGGVFTTVQPRSELTAGDEQIDVVRPDKVLRHVDDRRHQGHLTVMVGGFLGHRT